RHQKLVEIIGEKFYIPSGAIFEKKREPARSANTGNSRRRKGKCDPIGKTSKLLVESRFDVFVLLFRFFAFLPRLEGDEEEGAIGILNDTKQAEADDRGRVFHSRHLVDEFFDLARRLVSSLE